jgi:hypothetical protein
MLSAVIRTEPSYPAMPLVGQLVHQRFVHFGPLVLEVTSLKIGTPTADEDRPVSRRSEPSSRINFNWRTAKPLADTSRPGCDEPTSRCQTAPSMWTIGRDQPVIPGVAFIR